EERAAAQQDEQSSGGEPVAWCERGLPRLRRVDRLEERQLAGARRTRHHVIQHLASRLLGARPLGQRLQLLRWRTPWARWCAVPRYAGHVLGLKLGVVHGA